MDSITQEALASRINTRFKVAPEIADQMAVISFPHFKALTNSIFVGTWSEANARNLAGHLWGLSRAYQEINEVSRSRVFTYASRGLYEAIENQNTDVLSFEGCLSIPYIADKIRLEMVHYWACAQTKSFTPRTHDLTQRGATEYAQRVRHARWY